MIALGAGLGIWGVINLLEGYGNDNPDAKSQGMKHLMAGGVLIGTTLVPLFSGLFNQRSSMKAAVRLPIHREKMVLHKHRFKSICMD